VRDRLLTLLKAKVEGKCHGVWGYTVFVVITFLLCSKCFGSLSTLQHFKRRSIQNFVCSQHPDTVNPSVGLLDIDTGCAVYEVEYVSLVFRPFKNEILMAEVASLSSVRFHSFNCQQFSILDSLVSSLFYCSWVFFAKSLVLKCSFPYRCVISQFGLFFFHAHSRDLLVRTAQAMPNHLSFRHAGGEPCFYSTIDGSEIKPRCSLRVRISGLRQGAENMVLGSQCSVLLF
jgi:hypothetical protein